jgi:hypothetical protein
MTQQCLYLVSSSASREYVADCLECLALPRGSVHHFRYLERYVDDAIRQQLADTPGQLQSSLRNLSVVVVYLYQEQTGGAWKPAPSDNDEGAYIPLRCGRLLDAFIDGEIVHFYFELTDYIRPQHDELSARAYLNAKLRFRLSADEKADVSYAHMGVDLTLGGPASNDALWFQRFVGSAYKPSEWRTRSLGSAPLDVVYDVVFVRVGGLFAERDGRLAPLEITPRPLIGNPSAEYVLQAGATYHIQVATRLSARLPAEIPGQGLATLSLRFDPQVFRPASTTRFRISSAYDLHYWSIVPTAQVSQRSVLEIGCQHALRQDENFVRKELLCPELTIPVTVEAEPESRAAAK